MTPLYKLTDVHLTQPSVVTIGVFDGLHLGHQYLIGELVDTAHRAGLLAVVLTFFPHPDVVVRGLTGRYYLTTPEERAERLLALGVDNVVTHPFNEETRHMRAALFVEQLVRHLRPRDLWVGADFALGYQREGNVAFLRERGTEFGFNVHPVDLLQRGPDVITSTQIREALGGGDVETAAQLLGHPYAASGQVVHGDKRGRGIGFPTANIAVWESLLLPANGVYAGHAIIDNQRHPTVTNIGVRPTFEGTHVTVETHVLDFERDLYGQTISVTFEKRLRGEKKFGGLPELIAQIQADVAATREVLAG
jgi:riboflavin kinase/FMN adenylyltransferase